MWWPACVHKCRREAHGAGPLVADVAAEDELVATREPGAIRRQAKPRSSRALQQQTTSSCVHGPTGHGCAVAHGEGRLRTHLRARAPRACATCGGRRPRQSLPRSRAPPTSRSSPSSLRARAREQGTRARAGPATHSQACETGFSHTCRPHPPAGCMRGEMGARGTGSPSTSVRNVTCIRTFPQARLRSRCNARGRRTPAVCCCS